MASDKTFEVKLTRQLCEVAHLLVRSLEDDGGLPGVKDGLGAFPPGSDRAELMLALKLQGGWLSAQK